MNIWSYWEGPSNPLLDLCTETLCKHNPTAKVVTPELLEEMGGGHILKHTEGVILPYRSDLVRLWLIHEFGGVWTDTDAIWLQPWDFENADKLDLLGVHNPLIKRGYGSNGVVACPWAARRGSPIVAHALYRCWAAIAERKEKPISYGSTSLGLLSELWRENQESSRVRRLQAWRYNRVPWNIAIDVFCDRGPSRGEWEHCPHYGPGVVSYHLTNRVVDRFKGHTQEQILEGPWFLSWLMSKALGRPPGVFGRTQEIVKRLPAGECNAVEVGVLRGRNSRHILQQHPGVRLRMVDAWSPASYRPREDGLAGRTPEAWRKDLAAARSNVSFARDRTTIHQGDSVAMANTVGRRSQDLVFIDANHTYKGCKRDIEAWEGKVKLGGWIGGHDYNHPNERNQGPSQWGVKRAVDEWARSRGLEVKTGLDWTWWAQIQHA